MEKEGQQERPDRREKKEFWETKGKDVDTVVVGEVCVCTRGKKN